MKARPRRLYRISCCIKTVSSLDMPFELSLKKKTPYSFFINSYFLSIHISFQIPFIYIIAMISVPNISSECHPYPRTAVVDKAMRGTLFLFILHFRTYKNNTKLQSDICYVFFVVLAFIRSNCAACTLSPYMKSYSIQNCC